MIRSRSSSRRSYAQGICQDDLTIAPWRVLLDFERVQFFHYQMGAKIMRPVKFAMLCPRG